MNGKAKLIVLIFVEKSCTKSCMARMMDLLRGSKKQYFDELV